MINDKISKALKEFASAYGIPSHIDSAEKVDNLKDIYCRELAKHFNNHTIDKAISLAWTKARKFPTVSDFFEGYGGKEDGRAGDDVLKGYDL